MCFKNYFKKLVSFGLAFSFGLLAVSILQTVDSFNKAQELLNRRNDALKIQEKTINKNNTPIESSHPRNKPLYILSKQRPVYTEQARANNTQGKVILGVTFLASGEIGAILPISTLPNGLTEQAITAAKQMKFEPQIKNGRPITVSKPVQFNFAIY